VGSKTKRLHLRQQVINVNFFGFRKKTTREFIVNSTYDLRILWQHDLHPFQISSHPFPSPISTTSVIMVKQKKIVLTLVQIIPWWFRHYGQLKKIATVLQAH